MENAIPSLIQEQIRYSSLREFFPHIERRL